MDKPYVTAVEKEKRILSHIAFWGGDETLLSTVVALNCNVSVSEAQKWLDYSKRLQLKQLLMRGKNGTP